MWWLILISGGCSKDKEQDPVPPVDLSEVLGPDASRAGQLTADDPTPGGLAAEGRATDFKIYNDRVQFIVQGLREGHYYVPEGGLIIDADIVRPQGQPGRDFVDEWGTMLGIGRVIAPESIEVAHDGRDGKAAVIRVRGYDQPMALIDGALELDGLVQALGLEAEIEYRLEPGSWLLEVTTTITATTTADVEIGDVIFAGREIASPWAEGQGTDDDDGRPHLWNGYVSDHNDIAVALVAGPGRTLSASGLEVLSSLADLVLGFDDTVTLQAGESHTVTRYYGVGPDLATISDAALAIQGQGTELVSGTVTAPDGEVAGARVNVFVDGQPYTVAFTGRGDTAGAFEVQVPTGASWSLLADGRGRGLFTDLADGAGNYGNYGGRRANETTLSSYAGSLPVAAAQGRGSASEASPLVLAEPLELTLRVPDGRPFHAWVDRVGGEEPQIDERVIPRRPSGHRAAGWSVDGELELLLEEPGEYQLVASRGPRFTPFEQTLTLDGDTEISFSLPALFEHPGWILGDPHSHAAPSGDGEIPMEDRLVVSAALGVQAHFGTDHDHLADYRPLLDALGLGDTITTVVSDEVSPPLRGHLNIYPVEPDPTQPNNKAWPWWLEIPDDTESIISALRARHGDRFLIQANHPWSGGLASSAGWSVGLIARPDYWTESFQAIEVLNNGYFETELYFDLINRGILVTPVGVSDAHAYLDTDAGMSGTWIGLADATAGFDAFDDDALIEAMTARRTVASRGVFLDMSIPPGSVLTSPTTLEVGAHVFTGSLDTLALYRDGVRIEAQAAPTPPARVRFELDADEDASFTVIAEGGSGFQPWASGGPWALASAILLDVDGQGWRAPLAAFETP